MGSPKCQRLKCLTRAVNDVDETDAKRTNGNAREDVSKETGRVTHRRRKQNERKDESKKESRKKRKIVLEELKSKKMAIAEAESSINEQDNNPLMIDFYNALAEGQSNVSNEDQYPMQGINYGRKQSLLASFDAQRTTKLERARRWA